MLDSLKGLFARLAPPGPEDEPQGTDDAVRLAAAVLIAQVIRADSDVDPREREVMLRAMRDRCGLGDDEAAQLAALAESTASDATALHTFTSQINSRFGMPRKLRMLELLWRVAYADSSLGDHERHIVRRIADLLHVPQGANAGIRARIAQETLDTQRGAND